jgi:hypothetical protein
MRKSDLIRENERLRQRVTQLENILCPAEQHDYVVAERWFSYGTPSYQMEVIEHRRMICKRCFTERREASM